MSRLLVPTLLLSTTLALPAHAFDISAMTPTEEKAFGEAVKTYLMAHPETLVEAINSLQDRQQAQAQKDDRALIAANAKDLFEDPESWVGGNPDGDVTVVEFMDYRCGYCKKAYSAVADLLKSDGHIRFIVKEFPILGPQSELGARFAVAVRQLHGDAAYAPIHDQLMNFRGEISTESLTRLAKDQKLDPKPILDRMNSDAVTQVLRANYELAQRLQVNGTPAFVIGPQMLRGYAPEAAMAQMVSQARS